MLIKAVFIQSKKKSNIVNYMITSVFNVNNKKNTDP